MAKQQRQPTRPYTRMCRAVESGYRRRLWFGLLIVYSILAGIVGAVNILAQGSQWWTTAIAALLAIGLMIIIGITWLYLLENLQHSDSEDAAVERGIAFLREHGKDERIVSTVERRAERGSSAVQMRISLPILLLTLIATASGLLSFVPPSWQPIMYMFIVLVVLSLLREVARGNTDVIILSAIDEYRAEKSLGQEAQPAVSASQSSSLVAIPPQLKRAGGKRRNTTRPSQHRSAKH